MCESDTLPHIVQLLTVPSVDTVERCIQLVDQLALHNDILLQEVYKTGLFFFLFLYDKITCDDMASLLQRTHQVQNIAIEEVMTGISDDLSPAIKSILNGLLPREIIHRLCVSQSYEVSRILSNDVCTPYAIWNKDMRAFLKQQVQLHVADFITQLSGNRFAVYNFKRMPAVRYERLAKEFVVHHYYMSNFVDTNTWPEYFNFEQTTAFLTSICTVHNNMLASAQKDAYQQQISQCVRAQLLLLKHTKESAFSAYPGSIPLSQTLKIQKNVQLRPDQILLMYQSLQLVAQVTGLSAKNATQFLENQVIESIATILEVCIAQIQLANVASDVDRQAKSEQYHQQRIAAIAPVVEGEQDESPRLRRLKWISEGDDYCLKHLNVDEQLLAVIELGMQTLIDLCKQTEETLVYIAQAPSIVNSLIDALLFNHAVTAKLQETILFLYGTLCTSSNLQERSFMSGAVVFLLRNILDQATAAPTVPINLALLSVTTIRRLCGSIKSYTGADCPPNPMIQKALTQLFPSKLATKLQNDFFQEAQFIEDVKTTYEEPSILWNDDTRLELLQYTLDQLKLIMSSKKFDSSTMLSFAYRAHTRELVACNIFVRFFNVTPEFKLDAPNTFAEKLAALLRDEYKAFADSNDLSRCLVILEAMFNIMARYKELHATCMVFADSFPAMVGLLRPGAQFYIAIYYVLSLLFEFIAGGGNTVAVALIKNNITENLRDVLYAQLDLSLYSAKIANDTIQDLIRENVIVLLHKLFSTDNPAVLSRAVRNGTFLYVFEVFCGCFCSREILRKKASFLLSLILQDLEAEQALRKYMPSILADVVKMNPSGSLIAFDKVRMQ